MFCGFLLHLRQNSNSWVWPSKFFTIYPLPATLTPLLLSLHLLCSCYTLFLLFVEPGLCLGFSSPKSPRGLMMTIWACAHVLPLQKNFYWPSLLRQKWSLCSPILALLYSLTIWNHIYLYSFLGNPPPIESKDIVCFVYADSLALNRFSIVICWMNC